MNKHYLLSLFTVFGIFLGLSSMVLLWRDTALIYPALLIALSALIDRYDGRIARKYGIQSMLGSRLDYVNDIVSFLIAPMMMFLVSDTRFLATNIPIAFLFIGAGLFRLWRFQHTESSQHFTGLPTTLSGILIVLVVLIVPSGHDQIKSILVFSMAALMVSQLKFKKI